MWTGQSEHNTLDLLTLEMVNLSWQWDELSFEIADSCIANSPTLCSHGSDKPARSVQSLKVTLVTSIVENFYTSYSKLAVDLLFLYFLFIFPLWEHLLERERRTSTCWREFSIGLWAQAMPASWLFKDCDISHLRNRDVSYQPVIFFLLTSNKTRKSVSSYSPQ